MLTRPLWAEISRHRLVGNFRALRQLAGSRAELIAVVKANAYGHGALECGRLLAEAGARWLAVTCVEEAVALRTACPESRILVLSGAWPGETEDVMRNRLTPTIWEPWQIEVLDAAARREGNGERLAVHLEIDTGMSRQGVQSQALCSLLERLRAASHLCLEGVMTHFHSPEELAAEANAEQLARFVTAVDTIYAAGFAPKVLHAGNSANVLAGTALAVLSQLTKKHEAQLMVRPGLALYGYTPRFSGDPESGETAAGRVEPVLAWKSRITSLRTVRPGEVAGYNGTFCAARPTTLALLPVGYADGYSRLLSNRGWVLVGGRQAPIAGRVSMDQTIIDVTDAGPCSVGDEVVLLGSMGDEAITADDLAALTGTIPYEVLCAIGPRVPRRLVD